MAALIQYANGAPGVRYDLIKRQLIIGRSSNGSDICLPCSYVSKHHAVIELVDSSTSDDDYDYFIIDLESTNKTFVNGSPIQKIQLSDGDIVKIGRTKMKFSLQGEPVRVQSAPVIKDIKPTETADELLSESQTWAFSRRLSLLDE